MMIGSGISAATGAVPESGKSVATVAMPEVQIRRWRLRLVPDLAIVPDSQLWRWRLRLVPDLMIVAAVGCSKAEAQRLLW